jgi:hypothetical protein
MRKRNTKVSKIIRFGIGNPSTGAFAVWRLWVQGNETYLAVRSTVQQMKASLHANGRWYFMLSNKQGVSSKRPRPILPGITRGPDVIYAGGLVQESFPGSPVDDIDVYWYDIPKDGYKKSFTLFFVDKNLSRDALISKINPKPGLLGPLSLREQENVWVAVFDEQLAPNEKTIFKDIKDKIAIHVSGEPSGMIDAHALMAQTSPSGEMVFLAILLGKENIVIDSAQT